MKNTSSGRDQTARLVKRLNHYNDIKEDKRKVRDHLDKLMRDFVRVPFQMESERIKETSQTGSAYSSTKWFFKKDSEVENEKLSASRVAAILIKYRNTIKTMGAVHADFQSSLTKARLVLEALGLPDEDYKGLKDSIKLDTLVDRVNLLSKKYNKLSKGRTGQKQADKARAAINSIMIYHPLYYKLSAPISGAKSITNAKDKESIVTKQSNTILVNADKLYTKARETLANSSQSDWVDMVLALCCLTGRRPTEVMKTASFKPSKERKEYVTFNGVLKSRDRKLDVDFGDWQIPVFEDTGIIMQSLKTMRSKLAKDEKAKHEKGAEGGYFYGGYLDFTTRHGKRVNASIFDKRYTNDSDHNEAINQQYNGTLNERLRKWTESGALTIKSLRAIYTKAVHQREEKTYPESYLVRSTRILCYSKESISDAVKHYAGITIDNTINGMVNVLSNDNYKAPQADSDALLEHLKLADAAIKIKSVKAKKLPLIHQWAKAHSHNGMASQDLTVSYIRRNCKVDGKAVNADTAGLYLVLVDLVDQLETQTQIYTKNVDGRWIVESKVTGKQSLLVD